MNVNIKTNAYPVHDQVLAFITGTKIRIGKVVKEENKPFYVIEFVTNKKYFPYTQELIPVGDESSCVKVKAIIVEAK